MIRVRFLGTAAARPTVARNVTGIFVQREGESFLFDCGEGTQRQMMRFGTGFGISHIFISHVHADHFLGITGLLRTMGLQGRHEDLVILGPVGSGRVLHHAVHLGFDRPSFPVHVEELKDGQSVEFDEWRVQAVAVHHAVPALGFALMEAPRLGRFDISKARALGIPEGPLYGRLHKGETVEWEGKTIAPSDLVGPSRRGRKVVYSGDTRPCDGIRQVAVGADLLIHEATFPHEDLPRAKDTRHSTAKEAASLALEANVRRLVLTHISARYADCPDVLEDEARAVFSNSRVAFDGLSIEVPLPEDDS